MSARGVHHMSAERKLFEHGVWITINTSDVDMRSVKTTPMTTIKIELSHDRIISAAFEGFRHTTKWLILVIKFIHKHCPFLTLGEIMACMGLKRSWEACHAIQEPMDILQMHATLHAAGIDCGESP